MTDTKRLRTPVIASDEGDTSIYHRQHAGILAALRLASLFLPQHRVSLTTVCLTRNAVKFELEGICDCYVLHARTSTGN